MCSSDLGKPTMIQDISILNQSGTSFISPESMEKLSESKHRALCEDILFYQDHNECVILERLLGIEDLIGFITSEPDAPKKSQRREKQIELCGKAMANQGTAGRFIYDFVKNCVFRT